MAFNGSGTFSRLYSWAADAASGVKIRSDRMDAEMTGFATGLSTCITKDGQTTVTGNLPMATYRHTNVGSASSRTDYARFDQLQDGKANWVDSGGTADSLTATYSPAITTLVDGQFCYVRAGAANATTTPTFSPNGLTARVIVKNGGSALAAGDIAGDGHELILRYDLTNTRWELLNPSAPNVVVGGPIATVASSATIVLNSTTTNYFDITGTTSITGITLAEGVEVTAKFAGALTLTNGANLINISGANITTAAGDIAVFRGEASGVVRMIDYVRASGAPLAGSSVISQSVFTSSGTWTKPSNLLYAIVEIVGGGGGGGGSNASSYGGTGGGSGGYARKVFDNSSLSSTETVTIGAAGSAGSSGSSGGAGGNSVFKTLTANGGGGGNCTGAGGLGGTSSGGDLNATGSSASGGTNTATKITSSGAPSYFGGGGASDGSSAGSNGQKGSGGGGAGGTSLSGGSGGAGLVIVTEYRSS